MDKGLRLAFSIAADFGSSAAVESDALLGLARAVRRFDPARGSFSNFAGVHILGAVMSGRSQAWRHPQPLSLDVEGEDGGKLFEPIDHRPPPAEISARAEETALALAALEELPPRERRVLRLRFGLEGDPPLIAREVGVRLGITKQRVCQITDQALVRIRGMLKEKP